MRVRVITGCFAFVVSTAFASDHNNLEHSRPLILEDAYSIAFGEREFQAGFSLDSGRGKRPVYGLRSEFQYGFAKNQDLTVSFDSQFPHAGTAYELSYFRNLSRELEHTPAFGYRVGFEQQGSQTRSQLVLAATKAWHQYDKVHVNLGLDSTASPRFVLGYSSPVGYPKHFDTTMLAEMIYQNNVGSVGVGLRRQINSQAVIDLGLQHQSGVVRLVAGYSIGF